MKEVNIIPVTKIKRPKTNDDFRPLSIQSSLSKIFEIIMLEQIETFIQISQPFDQFGFRPGRSTVCLLRKCNINIVHNMNCGHSTILILLDFSKAFDTIAHDILIKKLYKVNFSQSTVAFLTSYLRPQTISNNNKSKPREIYSGVPHMI